MRITRSYFGKAVALAAVASILGACALPRPGPTKNEILNGGVDRRGDAFIVKVDDEVTRAVALAPALGFSEAFLSACLLYTSPSPRDS